MRAGVSPKYNVLVSWAARLAVFATEPYDQKPIRLCHSRAVGLCQPQAASCARSNDGAAPANMSGRKGKHMNSHNEKHGFPRSAAWVMLSRTTQQPESRNAQVHSCTFNRSRGLHGSEVHADVRYSKLQSTGDKRCWRTGLSDARKQGLFESGKRGPDRSA